jgi:hypothetical protein
MFYQGEILNDFQYEVPVEFVSPWDPLAMTGGRHEDEGRRVKIIVGQHKGQLGRVAAVASKPAITPASGEAASIEASGSAVLREEGWRYWVALDTGRAVGSQFVWVNKEHCVEPEVHDEFPHGELARLPRRPPTPPPAFVPQATEQDLTVAEQSAQPSIVPSGCE